MHHTIRGRNHPVMSSAQQEAGRSKPALKVRVSAIKVRVDVHPVNVGCSKHIVMAMHSCTSLPCILAMHSQQYILFLAVCVGDSLVSRNEATLEITPSSRYICASHQNPHVGRFRCCKPKIMKYFVCILQMYAEPSFLTSTFGCLWYIQQILGSEGLGMRVVEVYIKTVANQADECMQPTKEVLK